MVTGRCTAHRKPAKHKTKSLKETPNNIRKCHQGNLLNNRKGFTYEFQIFSVLNNKTEETPHTTGLNE